MGFDDPPNGAFFHLAVVFDGTNVQAYYNGVAAAVSQETNAVVSPLDTDKGWWIGKVDHPAFGADGSPPPDFFLGSIDEVHFWARALSSAEIVFLAAPTTAAELVIPNEIGEEFGSGAVFTSAWQVGETDPVMVLAFISPDEEGDSFNSLSFPISMRPRNASTPRGTDAELVNSVLGIENLTALITGDRSVSGDTPAKTLHLDGHLDDVGMTKLGMQIQWSPP